MFGLFRCDECKHKDSCICIPYGCENFELDLGKHDKQVRNDAINDFVVAYIDDLKNVDDCGECKRTDVFCCLKCFRDRYLSKQKGES